MQSPAPRKRVRASDVAAAAGVSQTAVSFVLNGKAEGNIAPETRARVLQAAKELGYAPDHLARSLRKQRTRSLGLVTDAIASSPFGGRLLAGATERCDAMGYALLVMDLHSHADREERAFRELERRRVDALLYATMGFEELTEVPQGAVPVVLANCTARSADEWSVFPDDPGGAETALTHLADLGHTRVGVLAGTGLDDSPACGNVSGPLRVAAFLAAAGRRGVDVQVARAGWEISDGYQAAMRMLDAPPAKRPTAVFAANDRVAVGALLAAGRLGFDVPGDLSVVGFDDQETLADAVVPSLTTVALPHTPMGDQAVELALLRVGDPDAEPEQRVLACELIVRGSSSPPPRL